MTKKKTISAHITEDQFNLARRRLFMEELNWQQLLNALVNAYICGDISVTQQGRYHIAPPTGEEPVVRVPQAADTIELEPDWGIDHPRPQVGSDRHSQRPRGTRAWGTTDLTKHLRKVTGRQVSKNVLRQLLRTLKIPKQDNGRWEFPGPDSKYVQRVEKAMNDGTYDALVREGVKQATKISKQNQKKEKEIEEAIEQDPKNRRLQRLKTLRSIEEHEA